MNNSEIYIIDNLPPEDIAMLQALYSRDPSSVTTQIEKVKKSEPGKFMGKFYVGYGHKSIGDCGTTTLFIEGISMLAAKAIQDWPLYSGQESSTRYLDFSKMHIVDYIGTKESREIHNKLLKIYNESLDYTINKLKKEYIKDKDTKESVYNKAIKAKAFDICRGFLPAGMTTMVAWHTNLRQAEDHLKLLRHHPLKEVRDIAHKTLDQLKTKYENSFNHKLYEQIENYNKDTQLTINYQKPFSIDNEFEYTSYLKPNKIQKYKSILKDRPQYAELPHQIRDAGDIEFRFNLDFGSYRDLQRQRSMFHTMPLLTTKLGFNKWYLQHFENDYLKSLINKLQEIDNIIYNLDVSDYVKQYYIPMGYNVSVEITTNINSAVYISELRSAKTVHATLRPIAQKISKVLKELIPEIKLYIDTDEDTFSEKRGTQDITEKNS